MSHRTPPGRRAPATQAGRNTYKCDKYRANNQRAKNKARKAATIARRLAKAADARNVRGVNLYLEQLDSPVKIATERVMRLSAGLNARLAEL